MKKEEIAKYNDRLDAVTEALPVDSVYRNEPVLSGKAPDATTIAKRLEKVKNDISGRTIPEKAKKLLTKAMNTPHDVAIDRINDLVSQREAVSKFMGYVELSSKEYQDLSQDSKDIQEAKNFSVIINKKED